MSPMIAPYQVSLPDLRAAQGTGNLVETFSKTRSASNTRRVPSYASRPASFARCR